MSGTIAGVANNTINVNGGTNCGFVNVTYTSATKIVSNGYALSPGVFAVVYGSGSCSTSFAASAITLAGSGNGSGGGTPPSGSNGSISTHVLTADYLGGYAGTRTVTTAQAAPVLNWAEISPYDGNNIAASGIKTLDYIDPFRQAASDPLYTSDESTFAHDCSGNRIAISYSPSVTQYLMDPGSADLESLMSSWQSAQLAIGHIDAFFYDDIDTLYGVPTLPCGASAAGWDGAIASFIGTSPHPIVFNGYGMNGDSAALIRSPAVIGGMIEDCYGNLSTTYTTGSTWQNNENLELAAAAAGKLFFCYNSAIADGAYSVAARQYIYASFLLTYSPSSSVLWEYFSTPSGLHVFPETQLVPSSPLIASPSSVATLQFSGGAYAREYAACSLGGISVGPCAAIVNPSGGGVPFPSLSRAYAHTLTLSGYGILDGGSASTSGGPPPSSVPATSGLIVFP